MIYMLSTFQVVCLKSIVDLSVELWNLFKSNHFHAMFMFRFIQTFTEYINYHIFYGNILKFNQVVLNLFFYKMLILYFFVFASIMEFWICYQSKGTLIVSKKCGRVLLNKTQVFK